MFAGAKKSNYWVVTWHVQDHAEGQVFTKKNAAQEKFYDLKKEGKWSTVLYDEHMNELQKFGGM